MAGEPKPLTIKTRAADEALAAGQKPCVAVHPSAMAGQPCTAKRKAAAAADEECAAKAKRKDVGEKKMTRLPQDEVSEILTHVMDDRAPHYFESLKRQNPSLLPSPEEEKDPSTALLYAAARLHYDGGERYARFQAFVRREYEKRGYVEVDEDFLARRAQARAWSDAERARVLKEFAEEDQD